MRKLYSFLLLATTLLLSTNVMAQNVCTLDGVEKASLLEAFNAANESADQNHTITLLTDVNINDPADASKSLTANGKLYRAQQLLILNKNITLDLAGHSINASIGFSNGDAFSDKTITGNVETIKGYRMPLIVLYKGSLDIIGTGTINNGIKESGIAVGMAGSNVKGTENFSVLTVGANVTLLGGTAGMGIYVDQHYSEAYNANYYQCVSTPTQAQYTDTLGLAAVGGKYSVRGCAYGVVINVSGKVYGGVYGIQLSGNVKARPTDDELEATKDDAEARAALLVSYPIININSGALVYSEANQNASTGIYAAGYGSWLLAGTIQGSTGAYMKSGNVDIVQGAKIESTNTANYNETVTGKKSGIDAGGSAIVIEATVFYAGGNSLDVKGGDIIAASGYAIDENRSETTPVGNNGNNITITAGNFQGGDEGLLKTTDEVKEKIKDNGTISGGVFDDATITEFLPNIEGYIQYADGGDNKYQVVPLPQGEEIKTDPATAADDSYVKMSGTTSFTVADGETKTFAALMLTSDDNVVTVKDGGKLVVSNAATILGNAKIIVEAGGTFIIEGAQGLIADNVNQLILEAQEGKMAIFMIHPDVTANTNPAATVSLEAKCYTPAGGSQIWQRIGVPAVNGILPAEIQKSVPSQMLYWDAPAGTWKGITASTRLNPFMGLALSNGASAPGQIYKFPCNLVGNSDGPLNLVGEWTCFANSYTANVDLYAMLGDLLTGNAVSAAAYVYRMADDDWDLVAWADLDDYNNGIGEAPAQTKLEPMQGFIFNLADQSLSSTEASINYRNSVWSPAFPAAPAPARRVSRTSDVTKAVINITATSGKSDAITLRQSSDYSNGFDNGADVRKNLTLKNFGIYANTADGSMAQVANNDIDGQVLTISSEDADSYKMTFSNIYGEQLAIRDRLTGAVVAISEGSEYFFSVAANSVNDRFEIVGVSNAPTALENIAEGHAAKGIYTVLGQYLGGADQLNKLPKGIYVVDGVKVVK